MAKAFATSMAKYLFDIRVVNGLNVALKHFCPMKNFATNLTHVPLLMIQINVHPEMEITSDVFPGNKGGYGYEITLSCLRFYGE